MLFFQQFYEMDNQLESRRTNYRRKKSAEDLLKMLTHFKETTVGRNTAAQAAVKPKQRGEIRTKNKTKNTPLKPQFNTHLEIRRKGNARKSSRSNLSLNLH